MPAQGKPSEVISALMSSWLKRLAPSPCCMFGLHWALGFGGLSQEMGFTDPLGGDSPAAMMRYMAKHH